MPDDPILITFVPPDVVATPVTAESITLVESPVVATFVWGTEPRTP